MPGDVRVSVEQRRGCGYRQEGGLYLVGGKLAAPCGALPIELEVCPTCGGGIHPSRGWTWVQPFDLLKAAVDDCRGPVRQSGWPGLSGSNPDCAHCPMPAISAMPRAGLLWIGTEFYPLPNHFVAEAAHQGVSRRIPQLPRDFRVGETWVLLAHRKAVNKSHLIDRKENTGPGIFAAFKPERIEQVVSEEDARDAGKMQRLRDRGIEPVIVRRA